MNNKVRLILTVLFIVDMAICMCIYGKSEYFLFMSTVFLGLSILILNDYESK